MRISNKTLIVLLTAVLLICIAAMVMMYLFRPTPVQVLVTVDGQVYGTYDLHTDQTVRIAPVDDSWYNVLEIRGGKASVTQSDCDNQICVHTPSLQQDLIGIIVCLPHGVAVELTQ